MYFGADFFVASGGSPVFFGVFDLEIPSNLFDLGIPVFFGNVVLNSPENYENCNYFFDRTNNFDIRADYLLTSLRNFFGEYNQFLDRRNSFLKNFSQSFFNFRNFFYGSENFSGFYNYLFRDILPLSGFESGSKYIPFFFLESDLRNYFSRITNEGFDFIRNISGISEKNSVYLRLNSESFEKYFEAAREFEASVYFSEFIYRGFEKIIDFISIRSEKINELQGNLFELKQILRFSDPYYLTKKINRGTINRIIQKTPENIYSVSADCGYNEIINDFLQKNSSNGILPSGLKRRVDELEEIILREKRSHVTDYDSVVRQLELELRSALNSCCEGVHF